MTKAKPLSCVQRGWASARVRDCPIWAAAASPRLYLGAEAWEKGPTPSLWRPSQDSDPCNLCSLGSPEPSGLQNFRTLHSGGAVWLGDLGTPWRASSPHVSSQTEQVLASSDSGLLLSRLPICRLPPPPRYNPPTSCNPPTHHAHFSDEQVQPRSLQSTFCTPPLAGNPLPAC